MTDDTYHPVPPPPPPAPLIDRLLDRAQTEREQARSHRGSANRLAHALNADLFREARHRIQELEQRVRYVAADARLEALDAADRAADIAADLRAVDEHAGSGS